MKNKPVRTCIACRKEADKSELLRIVRTPNGEYVVDVTGKANGRGAYVCKTKECVEKLAKTKALNRVFKCEVPSEVYAFVGEEVLGKKE